MSGTAARGAAGFLYASGRMRRLQGDQKTREMLRAADSLRRERERNVPPNRQMAEKLTMAFQQRRDGARS